MISGYISLNNFPQHYSSLAFNNRHFKIRSVNIYSTFDPIHDERMKICK